MPLSYRPALAEVLRTVIAPHAEQVDRRGEFPRRSIAALAEEGLLGLTSARSVGGLGGGLREAAEVVEQVSAACASTGLVLLMHYSAVAVIERHGPRQTRYDIADGHHLSTLALAEAGSRSHFWAPTSTATPGSGALVRLHARKSWVTSAGHADSYVWSSRPVTASDGMTLWLVPASSSDLYIGDTFDALGLRGTSSQPITADGTAVQASARLGEDGKGLDLALSTALPTFLTLCAAFSLGLMEAALATTTQHLRTTHLTHLDQTLADQPITRQDLARLRLATDTTRVLLEATLRAWESDGPDLLVRTLEVKAAAAEAATEVTDLAMKACGGTAFRKQLGLERHFRDARAGRVMAPTTDTLLDFIGRLTCGLPLF